MISIDGFTDRQTSIADLLWTCKSLEETELVIKTFGAEAAVVRDMIVAAYLDDYKDTKLAKIAINKIRNL
jgi:hypothetical protein